MVKGPVIRRNVLFLNCNSVAYLWDENAYSVFNNGMLIRSGRLVHFDKVNNLETRFILARDGLINWSVK